MNEETEYPEYPSNPTDRPQRANVENPDLFERTTRPRTTAVVPAGSAFGHTSSGLPVQVFDTNTGAPLEGVTIFPT
jgi:hypothetical protein